MNEFWVFGYGSLMWNPGFESLRRTRAQLSGYHRSLCISSHIYRGTRETPGLVMGLDRGGACEGVAFAVDAEKEREVMQYLRARELVTNAYRELILPITLANEQSVPAVCYVVDPAHEQYMGRLSLDRQAQMVRHAQGKAGANHDYVISTVEHLRKMSIKDSDLELVARLLEQAPERPADKVGR
ncbi:gamma-glutamylcyclotransferase [Martelella mediterranea]|uniref:glutathione-specific gamma-glutamylcyclotransferase n=1 Tax=Martelella mediterranea TaxID=293089 RepID=A0A4V2V504_9HYPH|nr:gamma-glutamylcyclotransferase [Martelella mediterranea]TCT45111.1 cation transport protein ChaC [Martelella mediterranea]